VSAVLWPLPHKASEKTVELTLPPAAGPILWADWSRTQTRRQWLDLLRTQTVTVTLIPEQATPSPTPNTPYTRRQRAHWRLSWSQRLARNACPANQTQARLHRFGIPLTVSTALHLAVA